MNINASVRTHKKNIVRYGTYLCVYEYGLFFLWFFFSCYVPLGRKQLWLFTRFSLISMNCYVFWGQVPIALSTVCDSKRNSSVTLPIIREKPYSTLNKLFVSDDIDMQTFVFRCFSSSLNDHLQGLIFFWFLFLYGLSLVFKYSIYLNKFNLIFLNLFKLRISWHQFILTIIYNIYIII